MNHLARNFAASPPRATSLSGMSLTPQKRKLAPDQTSSSDSVDVYSRLEDAPPVRQPLPLGELMMRDIGTETLSKKEKELRLQEIEQSLQKIIVLEHGEKKNAKSSVVEAALKKKTEKHKQEVLSNRQRRKVGLNRIDPSLANFKQFEGLHKMWKEYIASVLGGKGTSPSQIEAGILKSDLHGALIKVIQSTSPQFVAITGIIVQETKDTFLIVTPKDKFSRIPKAGNVFSFEVPMGFLITLFGNQLRVRSYERSTKSFKPVSSIEM